MLAFSFVPLDVIKEKNAPNICHVKASFTKELCHGDL